MSRTLWLVVLSAIVVFALFQSLLVVSLQSEVAEARADMRETKYDLDRIIRLDGASTRERVKESCKCPSPL